jgi:hypothetical protein
MRAVQRPEEKPCHRLRAATMRAVQRPEEKPCHQLRAVSVIGMTS